MRVYPGFVPNLGNDAFQYFSVAENALAGHFGYTSLIHFDAERSFGVTPAPMVTFPLGYPLAIALVSLVGLPVQGAALLICAVSTAACVPLLAWIADRLGMSRLLRNVVVAAFVFNATVIDYGASAFSEAPFMFVVLLGLALLVAARLHAGTDAAWRWMIAGLVFGAAYFVRYTGLFFVAGLAVLAVRHVLDSNRTVAKGYALAFAVATAPVLAGMTRNIVLVGNWRGGNEKVVSNSLWSLLLHTAGAANRLLLGDFTALDATSIPRVLFAVLFITGLAGLTWSYVRQRESEVYRRPALNGIEVDLLVLAAVYTGCMFYAGLTTVISYSARMFVPLMPLVLLLIGLALRSMLMARPRASTARRLSLLAFTASFCLYLYLNLLIFRLPPPDAPLVAKIIDSVSTEGKSARTAVLDLVGEKGVIVANNGQVIGHVLRRPTVSLVGPHYSSVDWNEKSMRDTIHRYHAEAIVIYFPIAREWDDDDYVPSAFVGQLARGDAPSWMKLVYHSSGLLVYAPHLTTR